MAKRTMESEIASPLQFHHLSTQVTGEFEQFLQGDLLALGSLEPGVRTLDGPEHTAHSPGNLIAAANEFGGFHGGGYADDHSFLCSPGFCNTLLFHIGAELFIHLFGCLAQG